VARPSAALGLPDVVADQGAGAHRVPHSSRSRTSSRTGNTRRCRVHKPSALASSPVTPTPTDRRTGSELSYAARRASSRPPLAVVQRARGTSHSLAVFQAVNSDARLRVNRALWCPRYTAERRAAAPRRAGAPPTSILGRRRRRREPPSARGRLLWRPALPRATPGRLSSQLRRRQQVRPWQRVCPARLSPWLCARPF
jgi:hypothetical protein